METYEKTLEALVGEMLEKMGFHPSVSVESVGEEIHCRIAVTEDQHFLIGKLGINMMAIQHIVRILARKKTGEVRSIIVDVNNYFADKRKALEEEASRAVEEALEKKVSVALRPMQAYERKVVHSYLAQRADVTTESVGEGPERKIMIRPEAPKDEAR